MRVEALCGIAVSLFLVVGCASGQVVYKSEFDAVVAAQKSGGKEIPAPTTLETQPWKIGQWVLYKNVFTTPQNEFAGFEKISVVAEDSCGTWIEWVVEEDNARTKWLICFRCEPNPSGDWEITKKRIQFAMRQRTNEKARLFDFRDGRNDRDGRDGVQSMMSGRSRALFVLARQVIREAPREDVDVPAGHFAETIRQDMSRIEVWSHPDVPLGGMVKSRERYRTGHADNVLVAYGNSGASSALTDVTSALAAARAPCIGADPADSSECEQPIRKFVILGWGWGGWSRVEDAAPGRGYAMTLQAGQRLRPRLHLVEEIVVTGPSGYSPDPAAWESHLAILAGIRWTPFQRKGSRAPDQSAHFFHTEAAAFYLRTSVGVGLRDRNAGGTNETSWAPIASVALGWLPFRSRAGALGFEFREQIARNSDGFQRDWALALLMQLSD